MSAGTGAGYSRSRRMWRAAQRCQERAITGDMSGWRVSPAGVVMALTVEDAASVRGDSPVPAFIAKLRRSVCGPSRGSAGLPLLYTTKAKWVSRRHQRRAALPEDKKGAGASILAPARAAQAGSTPYLRGTN